MSRRDNHNNSNSVRGVEQTPLISHIPISEAVTVTRKRVFRISHRRQDFKDALTQFVVMWNQLHSEGFTGRQCFNWSQGTVDHVDVENIKKLT